MAIPTELREAVKRDRQLAREVLAAAKQAVSQGYIAPVVRDITGAPRALDDFERFKKQQFAALGDLRDGLFFEEIATEKTKSNGATEPYRYLFSKARECAGVVGEDWVVCSWTASITKDLRFKHLGDQVEVSQPKKPSYRITVQTIAKFGRVLPAIREANYTLSSGDYYVEDEAALLDGAGEAPTLTTAPPKEYQAADEAGLREIIELADADQWRTMHQPFRETVLVEGPPGSGKTTIGLMRVPCLIDQQWQELGLVHGQDEAFHREATMRVLVMNEGMTGYLDSLIRSVGVNGLRVQSLATFCRELCREARTLKGTMVNETAGLTRLKFHPLTLPAYWTGFQKHIESGWRRISSFTRMRLHDRLRIVQAELLDSALWATPKERADLKNRIDELGDDLHGVMDRWVAEVAKAPAPIDGSIGAINLPIQLERWRQRVQTVFERIRTIQGRPAGSRRKQGTSDSDPVTAIERRVFEELRRSAQRLTRLAFNRRRIVASMWTSPAWQRLRSDAGADLKLMKEWKTQTMRRPQAVSEADFVLAGWLGATTMLVDSSDRGVVGGRRPRLTHIMVDEAQDLSPNHVVLLKQLVHRDGTMTFVGDLRQRISRRGHFVDWKDLGLHEFTTAILEVNHRQSKPLGQFVMELHRVLFGALPLWREGSRANAPKPRFRAQRGNRGLVDAVALEVEHWRAQIPNATVGVLYHGKWKSARKLQRGLLRRLSDDLADVRLAIGKGRASELTKTGCVIIASAAATKGLEFDAAVAIDPRGIWSGSLEQVDDVRRNVLYVLASRPKQGLSLILDDRSEIVCELEVDLYESVKES